MGATLQHLWSMMTEKEIVLAEGSDEEDDEDSNEVIKAPTNVVRVSTGEVETGIVPARV